MTRFLITGGSGFIGSALIRRLIGDGHRVLNLDLGTYASVPGGLKSVEEDARYQLVQGSIVDGDLVRRCLTEFEPKHVINLAAESHVDRSIDGSRPFIDTNIVGVSALLDESRRYWASLNSNQKERFRFIHISTDEVFGAIPAGEATPETPYNPSSPYAASKAAADHLVNAWRVTYGLPTIITNCSNNYGPFQFPEKLIPLAVVRALTGRSIPIYGTGDQVRDWIHVQDHCEGILKVVDRGMAGRSYLLGVRERRTNNQVVEAICSILDEVSPRDDGRDHASGIEFVEDRAGHDIRYAIDPSSAEAIGFKPTITFEDGLRSTVEWYVRNRDWWQPIISSIYDASRLGIGR